jgi:Domain of unknown function (DUF4276)
VSARTAAKRPLRVGIVCEGQRGCVETQVFPHLVGLICPDAVCGQDEIVPRGNRPSVLKDAPTVARNLLNSGCDVVFVIWDVFPEWRDQGGTTDCEAHRKTLDDNLKNAKMADKPIVSVAIHEELEAWLLCDAEALMAAIGPMTNKKPIPHEKDPDKVSNPKAAIKRLFKRGRGKTYNESFSAGQIAARLTSTKRLRRSQSFARLEDKLKALCDMKS